MYCEMFFEFVRKRSRGRVSNFWPMPKEEIEKRVDLFFFSAFSVKQNEFYS